MDIGIASCDFALSPRVLNVAIVVLRTIHHVEQPPCVLAFSGIGHKVVGFLEDSGLALVIKTLLVTPGIKLLDGCSGIAFLGGEPFLIGRLSLCIILLDLGDHLGSIAVLECLHRIIAVCLADCHGRIAGLRKHIEKDGSTV